MKIHSFMWLLRLMVNYIYNTTTFVVNKNKCLWVFDSGFQVTLRLSYLLEPADRTYFLLTYACYSLWRSIGRPTTFSIKPCPGQSFTVLSSCYPSFSCLLLFPGVMCYLAFLFSASLQNSNLSHTSWCSPMISSVYVLFTFNVFY